MTILAGNAELNGDAEHVRASGQPRADQRAGCALPLHTCLVVALSLLWHGGLGHAQPTTNKGTTPGSLQTPQLLAESAKHVASGDYKAALPPAKQAVALLERRLGGDHIEVAAARHQLANVFLQLSLYEQALPNAQRALEIRKSILGAEHVLVAESLQLVAALHQVRGEYPKAQLRSEQALAITLREASTKPLLRAKSLYDQANLYLRTGAYDKAEAYLKQTLEVVEYVHGSDHQYTGDTMHSLGSVYFRKGDYEKAEVAYSRALEILTRRLGPEHPELLYTMNGLGNVYVQARQYDRAAALYERTLELTERILGAEHPRMAAPLSNLAIVHAAQNEYSLALKRQSQALAIREVILGDVDPHVALSLHYMAQYHAAQKEYAEAMLLHERALTIREQALGEEHPLSTDVLDDLALAHWALGDQTRATEYIARALTRRETHFRLTMSADSTQAKRMFLTNIDDRLSDIIAFAIAAQVRDVRTAPDREPPGRIALRMLLQHKGRVLDSMTHATIQLRSRLEPDDQVLLDRYRDNRTRYATLLLRGPGQGSADAHRGTLRELQTEAEGLERDIGTRSQAFTAQVTPVSVATVQNTLAADEALVEWARYRPRDHQAIGDQQRGPERYAACIIRRTGEPVWVDLAPVEVVDVAVAQWRTALIANLATADKASRELYASVMAPVREQLGAIDKLYLAPDGALNLIPFAALRDDNELYLVEHYQLHYLTSGRDRIRLQGAIPARSGPLIVASPRYEAPGNPVRHGFAPLDNVLDEARAVAEMYPEATLITGEQATEGAIKETRGPSLLHVATHGYFEPLHCSEQEEPDDQLAATPTLRSGLALAGVNGCRSGGGDRADAPGEDGLLTALELAALDLQGTELAVLSACDTAVGATEIRDRWGNSTGRADGVYGLRRALILAGAETQLMTLWKVDDGATRQFMAALYGNLARGMDRSEALRAVQLAAVPDTERTPPRVWAAFIMAGADGPLRAARPIMKRASKRRGCGCDAGVDDAGARGWLWAVALFWLFLAVRIRRMGVSRA